MAAIVAGHLVSFYTCVNCVVCPFVFLGGGIVFPCTPYLYETVFAWGVGFELARTLGSYKSAKQTITSPPSFSVCLSREHLASRAIAG